MKKKLVAYSVLFSTENLDDPKKLYVKFLNEDYIEKHKLNISEFIGLVQQKSLVLFAILRILRKMENIRMEIKNTSVKIVEKLFLTQRIHSFLVQKLTYVLGLLL